MKFDLVLTNPPFQDRLKRGKTPHKLWIDFTRSVFDRLLVDDGLLCQVSPSSFQSPSNKVLTLMKENSTEWIDFDTDKHFPEVGSTFANYAIRKSPRNGTRTEVLDGNGAFRVALDDQVFYLPNDLCEEALSIHRKVVFDSSPKLEVEHDYVTCHNIILRTGSSLSREKTDEHVYPVFHTNRQIWWSSVRQEFANKKKVMWTRSGYTKPFYDSGKLGATDMGYFVLVPSASDGKALAHNMSLNLMQYIFTTAKWSGFGNERVFESLPALPEGRSLTDEELYAHFGLTTKEVEHVERCVG